MRRAGEALHAAGVGVIYLVHGTFVGSDAWGLLDQLERYVPSLGRLWRSTAKQLVDAVMRDVGNYSPQYARDMERALNRSGSPCIPVRRFAWSSENHHIGRADGAVRLLEELITADIPRGKRILLWGHSHAGNVFALLSHLLSGDGSLVDGFFQAARVYYRCSIFRRAELKHWRNVRERLAGGARLCSDTPLDFVTFGTPIRYGWNLDGCGKLLHFVNHRPQAGLPDYLAAFPPTERDVRNAAGGDYVQQLGIAGTNFLPNLLSWRACLADWRLARLLQPGVRRRELLKRLRAGMRVPEQGTTLLVDYGPEKTSLLQHLAGHGVYTRAEWMLFHVEEVVRRMYQMAVPRD